jgi:fructose-1,6-bisphosphatase/sedoheptulose 1,7-bisphosphatase-like protein
VAMNERDCICDRFAPVTEAAALAAAEWIGRGDGLAAGLAARRAMSDTLASMPISARVIAGRASADDGRLGYLGTGGQGAGSA